MKTFDRILLALSTVLLLVVAVLLGYNTYVDHQRRLTDDQMTEITALLDSQRELITGLLDDYEESAYDNPQVDRIAEQQLIAEETQLVALQVLAMQNLELIETLIGLNQ